jgi:4-hydroxy 2-oxovalerate aldolase
MKKIQLLDCTLRDGGRIIDCAFQDSEITDITKRLAEANIDFVEMGFLRDPAKTVYKGDSTFFTCVEQITPFIPKDRKGSSFVAFIDYSMYDFSTLKKYSGESIDGIRVGFTKKDFDNDYKGVVNALRLVKKLGYKLFIQGVNSLAYTDIEFLKIIEMVNEIEPYAFAIVDTYGAMYEEDFSHLYRLVDKNLKDNIKIAFHSHNNYQLSFALSQKFIKLANESSREIIIDGTLNGMGKCAGNLNLELIADYLVRKHSYSYKIENLMDIIDEYTYNIRKVYEWGYSIPSVLAATYQSHPNNVIYLTEKFRLATKDIKYILSMIPPEKRTSYDYNLIKELYIKYNHTKVNDSKTLNKIKKLLNNREILIIAPGRSVLEHKETIKDFVEKHNPVIIPVNFISNLINENNQLAFFGSEKRYQKFKNYSKCLSKIVVSNILNYSEDDLLINYESIIERNNENFDSSMIMLLNLLHNIGITKFAIAGFDGFVQGNSNYFDDRSFENGRFQNEYEVLTKNMIQMLKVYTKKIEKCNDIKFITPSIYEKCFENKG